MLVPGSIKVMQLSVITKLSIWILLVQAIYGCSIERLNYFSLEGNSNVGITETGATYATGHVLFDSDIPLTYSLIRSRYSIVFYLDNKLNFPALGIHARLMLVKY